MMMLSLLAPLLFAAYGWIPVTVVEEQQVVTEKTQHEVTNEILCSCVRYVRQFRPDIPLIDAKNMVPTTTVPYVGAVAVMRYASGASHVGYVIAVRDGTIRLQHSNVVPCKESVDDFPVDNYRIRGYL